MNPLPERSIAVVVGTPEIRDCTNRAFNHAMSIIVKPGGGGTMTVEFSNSPLAVTDPNNAANVWIDSGNGAMGSATEIARYAPTKAIRITALVSNGLVETKG